MLRSKKRREMHSDYRCSFCGKGQEQVERLIAGPGGVYICDECIALCQGIIHEERVTKQATGMVEVEVAPTLFCSACGTRCSDTHHFCFNCGQKLASIT